MKIPRDQKRPRCRSLSLQELRLSSYHQKGRYIVLETEQPSHQRIAVSAPQNLRVGALNAILRTMGKHKGAERQKLLESL